LISFSGVSWLLAIAGSLNAADMTDRLSLDLSLARPQILSHISHNGRLALL